MKVVCAIFFVLVMLTGCGSRETYETVTDELAIPVSAEPRDVHFDLAQDPVMPVMESNGGELYLCGDYDVMVQTLQSGDLDETVYQVSGFYPAELTLLQTLTGDINKYEFVWTCAAEEGQQIGRATLLDDGNYHYVLSATVDAELIGEYQEIWNGIFESFELG